jgi:hypothetical protein
MRDWTLAKVWLLRELKSTERGMSQGDEGATVAKTKESV